MSVGFRAKEQVVPARSIDLIHPQPGDVDPSTRLGVFPWTFDEEELAQASPNCRDWGEAWVLILESDETVDLAGFAELACGTDAALSKAACWLALNRDQDFFRLKQGVIQARPASEIRSRRAGRRMQIKAEQQSKRWIQVLKTRQPVVFHA